MHKLKSISDKDSIRVILRHQLNVKFLMNERRGIELHFLKGRPNFPSDENKLQVKLHGSIENV